MSLEDLKTYGKRCVEDEAVKAKAKEIGLEDMEGQIEYANSLGLDFSTDDLQALAKETAKQGELSDEDLESVAGGFVTTTGALVGAAVVGAGAAVVGAAAAATSASSGDGW